MEEMNNISYDDLWLYFIIMACMDDDFREEVTKQIGRSGIES